MSKILDARHSPTFRGGPSFTFDNRLGRLFWSITWAALARWTPNSANPWRILLLRMFGAKAHFSARVSPSVNIWMPKNLVLEEGCALGPNVEIYSMARIRVGRRCIVSQRAYICAGSHDVDDPNFQLIAKPILLSAHSWIAAEAFVGPGVTVGEGAVLGARSVAFSDLASWTIYRGNPAQALRRRAASARSRSE